MQIQIEGLEIYGYHGVLPEEKTLGQPFAFDVFLTLDECPGAHTDRVEDTIDYTEVIDVVTEVVTGQSFDLLERLSCAVAEAVLERFGSVAAVRVKATKPRAPIPCALRGVSAVVELYRPA